MGVTSIVARACMVFFTTTKNKAQQNIIVYESKQRNDRQT
jgi:hypothetical protein